MAGWLARVPAAATLSAGSAARRSCVQVYAGSVRVGFKVSKQVNYGESLKLVGSGSELGDWNVEAAPEMQWTDGDVWVADVELPADQEVHFKYVCVHGNGEHWESCDDHNLKASAVSVHSNWDDPQLNVQNGSGEHQPNYQPDPESERHGEQGGESNGGESGGGVLADERLQHNQWQGADVEFMQSNNHSKERQGVWDTAGLQGAALHIVQADEKAASWLGKMEAVKELLVDQAAGQKPQLDALAAAYVYLQWIGTGAIQCAEGGGHYRPNRHAELSRVIFTSLERVIGDPAAAGTRALLARLMHPKLAVDGAGCPGERRLPSFTEAYTASVPFTRIRDIAHRGDIPHELKQEIKHTIQNKLHRNAGPEDLVATERLIERLEREGGHPDAFMDEFRVFRGELRDFFNASSFTDMLEGVRPSLDDADIPVLHRLRRHLG